MTEPLSDEWIEEQLEWCEKHLAETNMPEVLENYRSALRELQRIWQQRCETCRYGASDGSCFAPPPRVDRDWTEWYCADWRAKDDDAKA